MTGLNMSTASSSLARPAQNLCVLCDGTWQSRLELIEHGAEDRKTLTNVALLAQSIAPYAAQPDADGYHRRNVVYYLPGVGTTLDELSRLFEGGTGAGLDRKVDALQGLDGAKMLGDAPELQQRQTPASLWPVRCMRRPAFGGEHTRRSRSVKAGRRAKLRHLQRPEPPVRRSIRRSPRINPID